MLNDFFPCVEPVGGPKTGHANEGTAAAAGIPEPMCAPFRFSSSAADEITCRCCYCVCALRPGLTDGIRGLVD